MLHSFSLQNYRSFKEPVHISLELNRHTPDDHRSFRSATGTRLSKAMAVIGANASGKTNLIRSLVFVDGFIKHSFQTEPDKPIPVTPHFSTQAGRPDAAHQAGASVFELEFELDDRVWRYRLVASSERVCEESLHHAKQERFSYVFTRVWNPENKSYAIKQKEFGLPQKEAEKVRENASLISTAAQYKVDLALKLVSTCFFSNVDDLYFGATGSINILPAFQLYAENTAIRNQMASLLHEWDFGLRDVDFKKHTTTGASGESQELHLPYGIHDVGGKKHRLPLIYESRGTQSVFSLLAHILPALQKGGLVVIDELEADLHPHMLTPILDLFFSPDTNPHNAQIIFTSHSIEVLSQLHKAQAVLVEKDKLCESDAWRLDSVKGVRTDDNLYAKYMAGAYGAVPQL